ncbi:MAG: protein kinase, partial [Corynebacterium nuruki]|nr:protein kinase [Corynebacterium nuruki]
MSLSNTTLDGRYLLGPVIGTGGMSDVYAATDQLLGRDVAVKMMRADLARDPTFLERFRREAQNAAKLNHHAIVAVYDTGQTDEASGSVPYIVMERVHGETLREIVQDSGAMPLEEASRVMAEVCRALAFSHEAGIIHRDIKPANIMITNTGAVKVMDFGIARALTDSTSAMTQTSAV